ncbi:MAG: hypothetical protein ABSG48_00485 [Geobacteraceae bacterium]|jgi:hypothetical protein
MEQLIRDEIRRFVLESPDSRFPESGQSYFDEPLVGFAAADDPLFIQFKTIIGEFHMTPPRSWKILMVSASERPPP